MKQITKKIDKNTIKVASNALIGDQPQIQEKIRPLTWFKPGLSGNPSGKPKGSRNRLQGDFFEALAKDFAAHGMQAIETMRTDKPVEYIKVVASLMPREFEVTQNPLTDLSDEALEQAITAVQGLLSTRGKDDVLDVQAKEEVIQSQIC